MPGLDAARDQWLSGENDARTEFLRQLAVEVVPALGCTEPAAVALAVARAREALGVLPERIEVLLSGNILKNAMGVGIPGTGMTGLPIAVALGAVAGDSQRGLEVFAGATAEQVRAARDYVTSGRIQIGLYPGDCLLYVEVRVTAGSGTARVILQGTHTGIVRVERDGAVVFAAASEVKPATNPAAAPEEKPAAGLAEIIAFVDQVDLPELLAMRESVRLNKAIAAEGLRDDFGLGVGKRLQGLVADGSLARDAVREAMILTAAASDARMGGSVLPVMSNSGSGNQGLTVTLPVIAVADWYKSDEEALLRALAQAHLVAIHIKKQLGPLSALCGCVVAAIGSACGIVRLLGGGASEVRAVIRDMVGNISGMVCDGAKAGCAVKVATAAATAVQTAMLALKGLEVAATDGIVDEDIERTLANLARLGREGMRETDKLILEMMLAKET